MKNIKRYVLASVKVVVLIVLTTCTMSCKLWDELGLGGFSKADAEAFSQALGEALAASMTGMQASPSLIARAGTDPCKTVSNYHYIDYTYSCAGGGTMHVTGDLTGFLSSQGTGILQIGVRIAINSCQCTSGSDSISTNPYINVTGTFGWLGWKPVDQSMRITGSFMAGTKTCTIQETININYDIDGNLKNIHYSGVMCDKSIDYTIYL
jgi:hypothetical protein